MSKPEYKKTYLYLWLLLAVALAVIVAIAFLDDVSIGGFSFKQGTFKDVILAPELTEEQKAALKAAEDGNYVEPRVVMAETDTTVKSVLIFGDSMTILVANRLAAYGEKNGYSVASVTWDASSTVSWSSCDTLDNFIARYKPDFIMVTLGSNELFLKNFDSRVPYIEKLIAKMGNIPFVWIGPPNWKEDVGFNAMMRKTLPPGTYYDSNGLDLPRGADHIHPTPKGGVIWTDSIMSWMPYTAHPIPSERPDKDVTTRAHKSHYYKAGGGKGTPPAELNSTPATNAEEENSSTHEETESVETPVNHSSGSTATEVETPVPTVVEPPTE